ncbi:MAG: DsrE/DsrF/DrsH-like family protein, partial [Gemmatimonadota bacterium]|nr:DsrE/DsrF/DrsH-like family protein [Gemmatimonadota bacterium]
YHIGGTIKERERLLVQTPEKMRRRFRIDVRTNTEITHIDKEKREVTAVERTTGREYSQAYDALILSPGAEPVRPQIPGIDSPWVLTLRNMPDMDAIIEVLKEKQPERAVVIGGGYIGLEMAEALRERDIKVTLVELADQVMGPADPEMASLIHQELRLHGVDLRLGTSVTRFRETDEGPEVQLSTGDTISSPLAVLAIGVKPEVELAREAGLKIGALGGIEVDERMRTIEPGIYAVGDAVEVKDFVSGAAGLIPLAGPANRQGRIAADNIFGRESAYKNTQGTAICKVFNLAIGMTGLSEKALKKTGIPFEKIYVHPENHAGYYPGAGPITLKLLFNPEDGKVLGAQAVGTEGVDKRIDVLAMALRAGLTVYDLEEAELSYAPPYGSAKDVINYAGFTAANALRGDVRICHVEDMTDPQEDQILLDVRTEGEVTAGTIPGARNIFLDELRDRLGELNRNKELLVFCQTGIRSYLACRILSQNGFKCRNFTGGYKIYLLTGRHPPEVTAVFKGIKDDTAESDIAQMAQIENKIPQIVKLIDACGLQCPGPIGKLKSGIDSIRPGEALSITATDPGFAADVPSWCKATGNELIELTPGNPGGFHATIVKRVDHLESKDPASSRMSDNGKKGLSAVVFNGDFDRAVAAFIIANGAASMGYKATLFFTFWGLNILRKDTPVKVKKTFIERMFGRMMPRGPEKLALSKMHMAGMGLSMIKGIMRKKNVASLPKLIRDAQKNSVRLVACSMSMDLMGIKGEELIDSVEQGGVATYLERAGAGNINLFI